MSSENKLSLDYATENSAEEKCQRWIESIEYSTTNNDVTSISEHSTEFISTTADSDISSISDDMGNININGIASGNELKILSTNANVTDINHADILQTVLTGNNTQTFGNIQVKNSNEVRIGNVTYVTGPIHIIHTSGSNVGSVQQFVTNPSTVHPSQNATNNINKKKSLEEEERNNDKLFVTTTSTHIDSRVLRIVDRRTWLAQPALEYQELDTPVPFVVISHTATETADTQAGMVYMVRNIQCFHIESRRWHDIAYNFLVGNDGNVYEGRGWKRIGSHTYGYNSRGIGISFVGCFMNELPAKIALQACKLLIERGVRDGYIQEDYQLIAHCQCSPTESPGRKLYEEIKTWPHWVAEP
ncbi:peptidoglycan-recognition protein LE isoform X1 [Topomyia yanbarensis]|uniref:peptidoglycan-recognition protein LE isoform X1 n=1 Tax=Topomyia yanbarensis TaxID=2498891 RepID=UPI00273AE28A|nr:peptidoglycan-recognition protein LE isoform X1 [Topomyia yanbarensis]